MCWNKCSKVSHRTRWLLWSSALLLAVMLGGTSLPAVESSEAIKPAPSWELKDVDGKTIRSSDIKGKIVILDFWATWCAPCRAEIPGFIDLQKQYGKDGVAVIGVSLDEGEPSAVKKFAEKLGVNYPILLGDQKIVSAFGGIDAIPTTFIIDREGGIASRHFGLTEKADLEKNIKPLLRH
jgi:peroxiredoxin